MRIPHHVRPLAILLLTACLPAAAQDVNGRYGVGGYELYLRCSGVNTQPTVVLLGGFEGAATWDQVEPEVAKFAHVCVYDSAGVPGGMSDLPKPNNPSDGLERTQELYRLLNAAKVKGPYVFVALGPSAHIARLFTKLHPNDVKGVVFSHGHTTTVFKAMTAFFHANPDIPAGEQRPILEGMRAQMQRRAAGLNDPDAVWDIVKTVQQVNQAGTLGNRPVVVLIPRLDPVTAQGGTGALQAYGQRAWKVYGSDQATLAKLSTNSLMVDAPNSWYHIEQDAPELVIDAVRKVLAAAQSGSKLK
ncbi:alpha/beta fold hydrolase [Deinococcus apachensis]|uniref:alpha/beta fold hydrolase n=1 Tax=Deinococcus apachensis TaxID=309886 RepID=UPI0003A5C0FE|nr:hypothetical protein [Deinococcus apachensis]